MHDSTDINQGRRDLLITGALSATAAALPSAAGAQVQPPSTAAADTTPAPVSSKVSLSINGKRHEVLVDTRTTRHRGVCSQWQIG